jgi:hypothetical protein
MIFGPALLCQSVEAFQEFQVLNIIISNTQLVAVVVDKREFVWGSLLQGFIDSCLSTAERCCRKCHLQIKDSS